MGIYVPPGWKHYARDRKILRRTFISRGKNSFPCSSQNFFVPGIMFFSLEDTFSLGFILWPTINLYILMGSVNSWPLSLPCIGPGTGIPKGQQPFGQNVTTFKVSKKKKSLLSFRGYRNACICLWNPHQLRINGAIHTKWPQQFLLICNPSLPNLVVILTDCIQNRHLNLHMEAVCLPLAKLCK